MPTWKISVTQPGYMEEEPEATHLTLTIEGGEAAARTAAYAAFRQEIAQTAMALGHHVPRAPLDSVMVGSWLHTITLIEEAAAVLLPRHPVDEVGVVAYLTPCPCEGSSGHLRSDFAWTLTNEMRALLEGKLPQWAIEERMGAAEAHRELVSDAIRVLVRWTAEDHADAARRTA